VPYTITHLFCPIIHTVLNGVLGSCSKLRSLNFIGRGVPEPLRTPPLQPYAMWGRCENLVRVATTIGKLQQVFLDTCNIRSFPTILDQVSFSKGGEWKDKMWRDDLQARDFKHVSCTATLSHLLIGQSSRSSGAQTLASRPWKQPTPADDESEILSC